MSYHNPVYLTMEQTAVIRTAAAAVGYQRALAIVGIGGSAATRLLAMRGAPSSRLALVLIVRLARCYRAIIGLAIIEAVVIELQPRLCRASCETLMRMKQSATFCSTRCDHFI
jgi:hypothetical protein